MPFVMSHVFEAGFSAVTVTITKQHSRLHIGNTLQVLLSPTTLRWETLVAEKQALGPH